MPPPNQRTPPPCWECDEPTDEPLTVTLRTSLRDVATLTLCARCCRTCYVPLAMAPGTAGQLPDGTLLVEPGTTDESVSSARTSRRCQNRSDDAGSTRDA